MTPSRVLDPSLRAPSDRGAWFTRLCSLDPYPVMLLLLPFLLLSISSNWMFMNGYTPDTWFYWGYFRDFVHFQADLFPPTYYGSRLPWLLPGYLAHKFLSPIAAHYVLHLTFYYAAVLAFYSIAKFATSAGSAFVASLLLGSYPSFLHAIGWNYVDGAGITYYLLTVTFLTQASIGPSRLWPGLAGASCAALVYTNLWCVFLLPFVLAYYFAARRRLGLPLASRALAHTLLFGVLGFALLTLLLGAVNYFVAGRFWFYAPSIRFALDNAGNRPPEWGPLNSWSQYARWLILPVLTVSAATIILIRRRVQKAAPWTRSHAIYQAIFLGSCVELAGLQMKGHPVLEHDFYASYLIPPMFIAIGCQLGPALDRAKRTGLSLAAAFTISLCSLPLWSVRSLSVDQFGGRGRDLLPALAVGFTWPVAVAVCRTPSWALPVMLTAIGGVYHLARPIRGIFEYDYFPKDAFRRIVESGEAVKKEVGSRSPRFWYSRREKYSSEFYDLNAIYLWGFTRVGIDFPSLPRTPSEEAATGNAGLMVGDIIVIPSASENALEQGNRTLKERKLYAKLRSRKEIRRGGVRYFLTFAEVELDMQGLRPSTPPETGRKPQQLVPAAIPRVQRGLPPTR